jgi:hypothetical protein
VTTTAAPLPELSLAALPESLRELVRVVGMTDALRLVSRHGGARVSVPPRKKATDAHPLCLAMGAEPFAKLVEEYGGEELALPKIDGYLRELRHEQVRQCRALKMTVDETAEATGYTRRHVMNIMGGDGRDTLTRDLFEDMPPAPQSYAGAANDPFGLGARK